MNECALLHREMVNHHIALVTINRPAARNAINAELAESMATLVDQLESDEAVRAVVLTGAGDIAFSAGGDLKVMDQGNLRSLFIGNKGFAGFVNAKRRKPWIAAVNGFAFAGGCEIALACDMIVARDDTSFSLPEVRRALVAGAGGAYRLVRAMPRNIAIELIVTGRPFSATQAAQWGMVNRLAAVGEVVKRSIELAEEILCNAPLAVSESLAIARQAYDLDDAALAALCWQGLEHMQATEDFAEGPRAFIEKRPPVWKGR